MLGKIKRSTADKHMSECVRIRAKWHCQRCGTDYTNRDKRGFQNSHFIGRGNYAVRYDPKNCLALCMRCHHDVTANPIEHVNLWKEVMGGDKELDRLIKRSECKERADYARANEKGIAAYYRECAKQLKEYAEATDWEEKEYDFESCQYREASPRNP
jgi:hypothetical protein